MVASARLGTALCVAAWLASNVGAAHLRVADAPEVPNLTAAGKPSKDIIAEQPCWQSNFKKTCYGVVSSYAFWIAFLTAAVVYGVWHARASLFNERSPGGTGEGGVGGGLVDQTTATEQRARSLQLDNGKVCGIFFVIFGHLCYYNATGEYHECESLLFGGQTLLWFISDLIRMPMMPMICFISGINSKGTVNDRRVRNFISGLLIPTCLWVCLVKPLILMPLASMQLSTVKEQLHKAIHLEAFWGEWYLQALVLWRGSTFLLWGHLRPTVAFTTMLILSCLAGYADFGWWGWVGALPQTFGFLPYFAAGLVIPWNDVSRAAENFGRVQVMRAIVLLGVITLSAVMYHATELGLYLPDPHGGYGGDKAKGLDRALLWTRRVAEVGIYLPGGIAFLLFVVPRSETPFTWMGPHTLYPFLCHETTLLLRDAAVTALPLPVMTSALEHVVVILLLWIPYVLLVMMAFSSQYGRKLFQWSLQPTWFTVFLKESSDITNKKTQDR